MDKNETAICFSSVKTGYGHDPVPKIVVLETGMVRDFLLKIGDLHIFVMFLIILMSRQGSLGIREHHLDTKS